MSEPRIYGLNVIPIREQAKTNLDHGVETAPFASIIVETFISIEYLNMVHRNLQK